MSAAFLPVACARRGKAGLCPTQKTNTKAVLLSCARRAPNAHHRTMSSSQDSLRIDRWLFFCRFFKSRGLATKAVTGGHVRLNGERASPGSKVKTGSRLEITKNQLTFVVTVTSIPSRRGPASEATACFEEDPASVMAREEQSASLRQDRMMMARTQGRPDKHTRRKLIDRNRG